jgi:hypothetical protein
VFVTSQGSAGARFDRFIRQRQIFHAEMAAREIGKLTLDRALELVALYVEMEDPKADRARVRWLARLLTERADLTLGEARRAADWLEQLAGPERELAAGSLSRLTRRQ